MVADAARVVRRQAESVDRVSGSLRSGFAGSLPQCHSREPHSCRRVALARASQRGRIPPSRQSRVASADQRSSARAARPALRLLVLQRCSTVLALRPSSPVMAPRAKSGSSSASPIVDDDASSPATTPAPPPTPARPKKRKRVEEEPVRSLAAVTESEEDRLARRKERKARRAEEMAELRGAFVDRSIRLSRQLAPRPPSFASGSCRAARSRLAIRSWRCRPRTCCSSAIPRPCSTRSSGTRCVKAAP